MRHERFPTLRMHHLMQVLPNGVHCVSIETTIFLKICRDRFANGSKIPSSTSLQGVRSPTNAQRLYRKSGLGEHAPYPLGFTWTTPSGRRA